ncbi:hypothetical protein [Leptolyngbya ohadii]|uniref:hypothetical protein n=1 Tax=Leptolyngbya ohadii TaxID=1962290 RepID=UPI0019D412FD|nr:hypothetical protein [Leptolyngbya ohadii]
MSYYEPPYFLLVAGLLIGVACGASFEAVLKQSVQAWAKNRSTRNLANLQGRALFIPFLGICIGICLFLGSGMTIFGFPLSLAFGIAFPLTLLIGALVWWQLGKILMQLQQGGSKALDLDVY